MINTKVDFRKTAQSKIKCKNLVYKSASSNIIPSLTIFLLFQVTHDRFSIFSRIQKLGCYDIRELYLLSDQNIWTYSSLLWWNLLCFPSFDDKSWNRKKKTVRGEERGVLKMYWYNYIYSLKHLEDRWSSYNSGTKFPSINKSTKYPVILSCFSAWRELRDWIFYSIPC